MYYNDEYLEHIGVGADDNPPGRGSGRYPKGSGKNPFQHEAIGTFYNYATKMEKEGFTEKEIAESLGLTTTRYRSYKAIDGNNLRRQIVAYAKQRDSEGISREQIATEIREKFNTDKYKGESSVRSLLNGEAEARMNISMKTAENLKKLVDEKGTLDVGIGVEKELGITRTKLDEALDILSAEGYELYGGNLPQATNKGQYTRVKILAKPGTEHKEIYKWDEIGHITDYTSPDDGDTLLPTFQYPESMKSDRLKVRFAEEGGTKKDGLVEIRPGVKDLNLGEVNYAQVRILVDDKYYIKGMAVYGDPKDFPDGVDVIFNTNKSAEKGKLGALKSAEDNLKKDPTNPFGSAIKMGIDYPENYIHGGQSYYLDDDGKYKLSLINKRADAGDWEDWSKELPSQMLSKQPLKTIQRQLNLAEEYQEQEYKDILEISNPTIKRQMLNEFAGKCDRAAIDLKAAPFPGQKYQVILPLTTIKDDEIYAPNYEDGAELALIRYPHGGTFEIPIVKVNNRNKEGQKYIKPNAPDAVGISKNTADRLSGADFDGDTVMVIPLQPSKFKIESQHPLKDLVGFDPKVEYQYSSHDPNGGKWLDEEGNLHYSRNGIEFTPMKNTQMEMGKISNLITDMTLKGASNDELARAVKHSMVVIDAEKHGLDWQQSEIDNGIAALKKKYQEKINPETGKISYGGASTLISRAKSPAQIKERQPFAYMTTDNKLVTQIDPEKGLYMDEKTGVVYQRSDVRKRSVDPNTGKLLFTETGNYYKDVVYKGSKGKIIKSRVVEKDGELYYKDKESGEFKKVTTEKIITKPVLQEVPLMSLYDDASVLSSGKPQEKAYVEYANKMKALANEARKEALSLEDIPYSKSAKDVYSEEVKDLIYQYNEAAKNAPRERHANMIADAQIKLYKQENPGMSEDEEMKKRTRLLTAARAAVGAKRKQITISDKQWEAIMAGAISPNRLKEMMKYIDKSRLKQLATPYKNKDALSKNQISRMNTLLSKGYTIEEVAKLFGVSASTISKYSTGKE